MILDAYEISEYIVCNKFNKPLSEFSNKSALQILSCIQVLQQQGIEQMEYLQENQPQKNEKKQIYQEINAEWFQKNKISYKNIDADIQNENQQLIQNSKPIKAKEKNAPANRKHLKALGYSWQRGQFEYQPESIFGLLLGFLQKNQQNQNEYDELSQTLYKYYKKQQQTFTEVKDYLVNTMFLLGRKGLNQMEGVSPHISELRKLQEQIKELIPKIYDIATFQNDPKQNQKQIVVKQQRKEKDQTNKQLQKDKQIKKENKKKEFSDQQNQLASNRERSRDDKKKKKHRQRQRDQQSSSQSKNQVKKKKKHKHKSQTESATKNYVDKKEIDSIPSQTKRISQIQKSVQIQKDLQIIKKPTVSIRKSQDSGEGLPLKRGRGRPRGSGKKQILERQCQQRDRQNDKRIVIKSCKFDKMIQKSGKQSQNKGGQTKQQQNINKKDTNQGNSQSGFGIQFDSD